MKTEGPILVTSPGLAYVSLDIEWSNINNIPGYFARGEMLDFIAQNIKGHCKMASIQIDQMKTMRII